jgi:hypothetical protein
MRTVRELVIDAFFQGDDSTRSETMPPVVVPNHNDRALRAFCEAVVITLLNIDESESDFETAVGGSPSVPIGNDQLYWFVFNLLNGVITSQNLATEDPTKFVDGSVCATFFAYIYRTIMSIPEPVKPSSHRVYIDGENYFNDARGGASFHDLSHTIAGGLSNKSSIDDPIIFVKHVTGSRQDVTDVVREQGWTVINVCKLFPTNVNVCSRGRKLINREIDDILLLTTALFEKNYYGQYKAVVVSNDQYRFATNDIVEQIEILCFRDMCNSTYGGRPSPGRVGLWIALTTLTCIMALV